LITLARTARRSSGFTLIELLITVSLLAIVLALGIPSFQEFVRGNQASALASDFARDIARARTEAISANRCVKMCQSDATSGQCLTTGNDWQRGWVMFVLPVSCDNPNVTNPVAAGARLLAVRYGNAPNFTLAADGATPPTPPATPPPPGPIVFDPRGVMLSGGNANYVLTFTPEGTSSRHSRSICVSQSGRANIQRYTATC